jgi:prephenate dehydrogenase
VLANVLVGQAARELVEESQTLPATGPSFRDATRVAGANPLLWRDIFVSNREAIVRELDAYAGALDEVRERLRAGDGAALERWIEGARADRRRLLEGELGGGRVSELRVPVPNRPGIVAQIALALGEAGINIVDMALYPAPDMRSGAIALWVAGEGSAERAAALVADLGYAATPVAGGEGQ